MFTPNKDIIESLYTPVSEASGGGGVSGIEAFDRAYEANARASSAFAIAHAVGVEQDRINADLVKSGEEPLPRTWYSAVNKGDEGPDLNTVTSIDETGREFSGSQWSIVQYNKRISDLRKKHPDLDLPLVGEQFERVKKKAEEARLLQEKTSYSGVGGYASAFAGQVAADMNPALNPVNTLSLGFGGFGKTAAMRIGTEIGINTGVEFVNQATGVNEQRRLLGLPEASTGEMIGQSVAAGVGAGLLQGVGEGVAVLAKKWFPNLAHDPAPPPRPDNLRFGDAPPAYLSPDDLDYVVSRQYSDFERASNPDINAHTVTQDSLFGDTRSAVGRFEVDLSHVERAFNEIEDISPPTPLDAQGRSIDVLARETDPDTFRMFDRIREEQAKTRAKLEGQIAYEKRAMGEAFDETAHPGIQEKRDYIMFLDEQARELAPLMGRAYAHAEGAWVPSEATKEAVERMVAEKVAVLPERSAKGSVGRVVESSNFMAEESARILERFGGATVGESETQALVRLATKELDETDMVLEKSITSLPDRLAKNELPDGLPGGMDLDQVVLLGALDANGEHTAITLREFLQDVVDDELEMKAVSVCSLKAS